ncbi:hypothetical protein V6Z05_15085 [Leptospira venezuelensis]|uniref:hypothetical protein n=1 Tax=Leptospira venezuelensis TaxID=1958811 RepID=UPI000A35DAAC|nr:hypothetical protein [Leptospira venezuelensis]
MSVPKFNIYFPSEDAMDNEQAEFYKIIEASLKKGEFVDIEGNISYVFVYLYKLLSKWDKTGFDSLSEFLIYLSEIYIHEKKLSEYCLFWAYDCLLGQRKYESYLEKTEPQTPFGTSSHISNLRLNIQKKIGITANPIDILRMAGGRKSKFIINNQALYKDKCRDVFSTFSGQNGNWFDIFEGWNYSRKLYPHLLFSGAMIPKNPEMEFPIRAYYSAYENLDQIRNLAKEAENIARKEIGVPQVGEGWISETELFRKLESEFSITTVIQHGQPQWIGRQHFDIWFPNWKIAVEYHGSQHFGPVDFFGGVEAFEKTVERDLRKSEIAKKNGVKLIIVTEGYDLDNLIREIRTIAKRKISAPTG